MSEEPTSPDRRALLRDALRAVDEMQAKLDAAERRRSEPIAIVGMGCRFPGGVTGPEDYWRLLRDGVDAVREVPAERWAPEDARKFERAGAGAPPSFHGGFLDGVDRFDPHFFGISPREAASLDPQQRLVLEVSWEALEYAGIAPDRLAGTATGVFVGITTTDYAEVVRAADPTNLDVYFATGNAHNVVAGRLSYLLGLRGPSLAVDTACSSSLTAVHLACQSLRLGESNLALAGGVNVLLLPDPFVVFSRWGMMAPDGRCKTFDVRADGFVRSEGCGVVVLKRLSDALAAGDRVLAVIRGSAVNQDGASSGLTVPNGPAQQAVVRQALAAAGVAPAEVDYVEAHGTGTSLGDPIELEALDAVLSEGRPAARPLVVGSVKTNIGHCESASGVAGLIKVVLALEHEEIPPHLHFETLTPKVALRQPPIVPTRLLEWRRGARARLAGVSSFGFSGTNAHVVLEESPVSSAAPSPGTRPAHLVTLSAKTDDALRALAGRYAAHIAAHPETAIADVAVTTTLGRAQLPHRLAVVAEHLDAAGTALAAVAAHGTAPGVLAGRASGSRPPTAFLFPGQGAQWKAMGRELHHTEPVYRDAIESCATILRDELDVPLAEVLEREDLLVETRYTQPALFAVEWALAQLWRAWGVEPDAVLGHSVGEYVAACVAGVIDLDDALRLIAARGRLMQERTQRGAMAAVFADEATVSAVIAPRAARLAVAAVNAPDVVVVSGDTDALAAALDELEARGLKARRLAVSHAFHSPLMDPILADFARLLATVRFHDPRIPVVSNLTGGIAGAALATPEYWVRHLREPVRFSAGIRALHERGVRAFVEVGPGTTLLGLGRRGGGDGSAVWVPSLRQGRGDGVSLAAAVGQLWVAGVGIDWARYQHHAGGRRIALPTYPFQRERHWASTSPAGGRRRPDPAPADTDGASHPLLGRRLRTAGRETIFESCLTADAPGWLRDHRVHDTVILPGTAYLEMGLAVAAATAGAAPHVVEAVAIEKALALAEDDACTVQVVLGRTAGGQSAFEISSLPDGGSEWQLHARGRIGSPVGPAPARLDLAGLRASCPEPVDVAAYYETLQRSGVEYGPSFRGLDRLYRGAGQSLGAVRLPADVEAAAYRIHPALLDACLQACGAALPATAGVDSASSVYLPIGVGRVELYRHGARDLWVHAGVCDPAGSGAESLAMDLTLLGEDGEIVARLLGLELRRVSREALKRSRHAHTRDWTYEPVWQPAPRVARAASSPREGAWAVLVDRGGIGDAIARGLQARGQRCVRVRPGPVYRRDAESVTLDPARVADFERLLGELAEEPPVRGIVHVWSVDEPAAEATTTASLRETQARDCGSLLALVQALARRSVGEPLQLCVVTRGTAPVARGGSDVAVASAPLGGLADVVALEHPELACLVVDLDPAAPGSEADDVLAELLDRDREDHVAFRGGLRHVRRLVRWAGARGAVATADRPVTLAIDARGVLDQLTLRPTSRPGPGPGEVSVRVRAAGLNFRDVLNVLGMYPGDAGPLGNECAGTVEEVGAGVDGLAHGQAVIALAGNSFGTFTTTPADLVVPKPERLSFEEAATIPIAFLTAVYGLQHCVRLAPGERVLIHAAAGGVGLAAVQLAQKAGAEVFATAGSVRKRAFLASLGVPHVMDSRSLDFAEEIRALTSGHGVDVVLNSLSGDFIARSVDVLAAGGRFVEIGKRDIWDAARMKSVRPDVEFHVFDLGEVLRDDRAFIVAMLRNLVADFRDGRLSPSPWTGFPLEDAAGAFRHMAQARHIGKVVLTPPALSPTDHEQVIEADASYLVTGGLGALGLQVAASLAEAGARHLVLVGRRPPSAEVGEALRRLEAGGVRVDVVQADVARTEDVRRLLEEIQRSGPPLRGIVHAAGVLDDGVLAQLSWDRFQHVLAPKVEGAWNLHALTEGLPLRFFVLFSSAAALLGSPGQGSYTAANAFLDALAHHRRARGLPALSINWGAWADVGMAAARSARQQERSARWGVETMAPADALAVLHELLRGAPPQLGVLRMDWTRMLAQFPAGGEPPRLAMLAEAAGVQRQGIAVDGVPLTEQLRMAAGRPPGEVVVAFVRERVGAVLGLSPSQLDAATPLVQLGLDSLMAVELKNRIERDGAPALPLARYLDGSDIAGLAGTMLELFGGATSATTPDGDGLDATELLARLPEMSEAEIDTLLARMTEERDER